MTTSELLTLDELAAFLKVSRDTVYRMAQQKRIPGVKVGNQWRFAKVEVMEALRNKETGEAQDKPDSEEAENE